MRMFLSFLTILALLALTGCGDDPAKPKPQPTYSGTFIIADTLSFNDCAIPAPLGYSVNVTVAGDSIVFAGFHGSWDPVEKRGQGVSPEVTVPVTPPTCNAYYTVTFDITYTDYDHFYGTYRADYTKDPTCPNPDPCYFEYRIGGTRP